MAEYTKQCGSRLPCGLCLITNQPCPYIWQSVEITYNGTGGNTVMTGTPPIGGKING